jgi:hypothetical protein
MAEKTRQENADMKKEQQLPVIQPGFLDKEDEEFVTHLLMVKRSELREMLKCAKRSKYSANLVVRYPISQSTDHSLESTHTITIRVLLDGRKVELEKEEKYDIREPTISRVAIKWNPSAR